MHAALLRNCLAEDGQNAGERRWPQLRALLLVDDDPAVRVALAYFFRKRGLDVLAAHTLADAKACFRRRPDVGLIVSDFHLPDGTGMQLFEWVGEQATPSPRFLLTSGAFGAVPARLNVPFLAKPFSIAQLEREIDLLLERGT